MRIAMVSGEYPPRISGVGDYCQGVSTSLVQAGHSVTVVTTGPRPKAVTHADSMLKVIRGVPAWRIRHLAGALRVLKALGRPLHLVIQYHCPSAYGRDPMINLLPAAARASLAGLRACVVMHGFAEQSQLFRLRTLPMLRTCHGAIYCDRQNERLLRLYGGSGLRTAFIPITSNILRLKPDSCSRVRLRTELGIALKDIVVAFFGGIGASKGFEYLLEAVRELRITRGLPVRLLAIGGFHPDGVNRQYQAIIRNKIKSQNYADWTHIETHVPATRVSQLLSMSDLAVYPFTDGVPENSGSMLAALAHGLPTVVTRGTGRLPDEYPVASVPARDPVALADCIAKLCVSVSSRHDLGGAAFRFMATRTWDRVAARYASFLESLE